MKGARAQPGWDEETLGFMEKVLLNSGVGAADVHAGRRAHISLAFLAERSNPSPLQV